MPTNTRSRDLDLLRKLYGHVSARRKKQFLALFGLMLLSSVAEVISLSAVIPFIGVITQPEVLFTADWMQPLNRFFGFETSQDLLVPVAVAFALAALLAGAMRLTLLWVTIRLGNAVGADLSIEIYKRTLYQPYAVHISRNSSDIISGITQKVVLTSSLLMQLAALITSVFLFLSILGVLFVATPTMALFACITFGGSYLFVAKVTRSGLRKNSEIVATKQTHVVKTLQEGLGAIRDVLLSGSQALYLNSYGKAFVQMQHADGKNRFISQSPRYAMEAIALALMAGFVWILILQEGGTANALPMLGLLAFGAQRILPLMQQIFGSWSSIIGSTAAMWEVVEFLDQPSVDDDVFRDVAPLDFKQTIGFENVTFAYSEDATPILRDVSFSIPKGATVGIIGPTGSGKSTLIDLVTGLIAPSAGLITVDQQSISEGPARRRWQSLISHVPQTIFISDATIAENIAFTSLEAGVDLERVETAARSACLDSFIERSDKGYATEVGERGVRMSGGQRQRLGIARALYRSGSVLVLDEATSALDNATEAKVMESVNALERDLTIFMIAHRISTLLNCDFILRVSQGTATLHTHQPGTDIEE